MSSSSQSKKRKRLPLPVDAILREQDSSSITPFVPLALKLLRYKYPRLPSNDDEKEGGGDDEPHIDEDELVTTLLTVCRPSATLFRLQRYVNESLKVPISCENLLLFLRSRNEFAIRNVHHAYRQSLMRVLPHNGKLGERASIHERGDDPRLVVCKCDVKTSDVAPCESLACIVPHVVVIARADGLKLDEILPNREKRQASTTEYAAIVAEARELYGTDGI